MLAINDQFYKFSALINFPDAHLYVYTTHVMVIIFFTFYNIRLLIISKIEFSISLRVDFPQPCTTGKLFVLSLTLTQI